jgi:SAM-dependent methyltransferase
MRWLFDQLDLPNDARVLEIGCGDAKLWTDNRDRLPAGWEIALCDMSAGMLAQSRRNLVSGRFAFVQLDAEALPFAGEHFDAIIANHVLYHVNNRPRAYSEFRRVLRKGGRLLAATNGEMHLSRLKDLIAQFLDVSAAQEPFPFSLENGAEQFAPYFSSIDCRRVGGELRIDDADVVVGYVMSIQGAPQRITGERLAELQRIVRDEIDRNGAFVVGTAAGLFVARAPRP